jgi:hypothetical protein
MYAADLLHKYLKENIHSKLVVIFFWVGVSLWKIIQYSKPAGKGGCS